MVKEFAFINLFRAIAAFWVLAAHCMIWGGWYGVPLPSAKIAVDLFMMISWLQKIFEFEPKIEVQSYTGLTVNFCETHLARYILRGIRSSGDFEFERAVSQTNRVLSRNIETIFILANPSLASVSSSIVRDVIMNGGDPSPFIPEEIENLVQRK